MSTKAILFFLVSSLTIIQAWPQGKTATTVEALNRQIDEAVVQKNLPKLRQWYAPDFLFTHGTGVVEGKDSWLHTVADTANLYLSRTHDSLTTEMHGKGAIIYGKLRVQRANSSGKRVTYELWYVRVFMLRKRHWKLVSHRTVSERHLNEGHY